MLKCSENNMYKLSPKLISISNCAFALNKIKILQKKINIPFPTQLCHVILSLKNQINFILFNFDISIDISKRNVLFYV